MYAWIVRWIFIPWSALLIVWVVAAMASKPTVQRESAESRWLHIVPLVVAYWLLWGAPNWPQGNIIAKNLLPATATVGLAGMSLTVAGTLFCIWARLMLGRNWSGTVTIKQNHELIRRGPYRLVRHPIYTGLILASLGTAIVFLRVGCFAAVLLLVLTFWFKLRLEEQFMMQQFGEEYARYRSRVRALIPFVL